MFWDAYHIRLLGWEHGDQHVHCWRQGYITTTSYGHPDILNHYTDVIMTTMASQITSLTVVYSTVYSDANQTKHQISASLAFVWGIHPYRWIPRTQGQLRGTCFHLMTSSWHLPFDCLFSSLFKYTSMKTSTFRVTGLCDDNPSVTDGLSSQEPVTRKCFHFMTSSWVGVLCFIYIWTCVKDKFCMCMSTREE